MNPATYEEAKEIAKKTRAVAADLKNVEVVACPPYPFLTACQTRSDDKSLSLGAQTVSVHLNGAHTGDVGVGMLKDLGVEYVIVGHSERREAGETDETVSKKIAVTLDAGMTAVVCVGEKTRDESGAHLDFLTKQMKQTFAGVPESKAKNIVIAYEPVWAIGAKEAMKPEDVYEMSLFVKKVFGDIFGGALANDFYKAKGYEVGISRLSKVNFDLSVFLKNPKLVIPVDIENQHKKIKKANELQDTDKILDAGPQTLKDLEKVVKAAKFILWNGPLGLYEDGYRGPTLDLAKMVGDATEAGATTIVGGGDTLAAIAELGNAEKYTFISTAGGAMLDFLAKGTLPGLVALDLSK